MSMSTMKRNYSADFYSGQEDESARSASVVVECIRKVLGPRSVLDVGCGVGPWVRAFKRSGTAIAHGLDGPWARDSGLLIADEDFTDFDFLKNPAPFRPSGLLDRYDLVTTFEFVEHLGGEYAPNLVEFLTSKADAVIIGGAIPGQGGSHHVNEQWPSYWAELMGRHSYVPCDFIRPMVWNDDGVMSWYRQNSIAYFKDAVPKAVAAQALHAWAEIINKPLDLVHPATLTAKVDLIRPTVGNVADLAKRVGRRAVKALVNRN